MNSLLFLATFVLLVLLRPTVSELRSWLSEVSRVCDLGSISGIFSTFGWSFEAILLGEFWSAEFYKINFDEMINNAKRNETNNIIDFISVFSWYQASNQNEYKNKIRAFRHAAQKENVKTGTTFENRGLWRQSGSKRVDLWSFCKPHLQI